MATKIITLPESLRYSSFDTLLDGRLYKFTMQYHQREDRYYFDLFDATSAAIVHGVKVMLNVSLLRKVADLRKPPGTLLALDTSGSDVEAGLGELGSRVLLIYEEA